MTHRLLDVAFRQEDVTPDSLAGKVVVVIDVLRFATSAVRALSLGAKRVEAFRSIEEVHARAGELADEKVIIGGEQGGRQISGFDLGNSPREYTRGMCEASVVLMVTTNGTRALAKAADADEVLLATLSNTPATARYLAASQEDIIIVAAGTAGKISGDDVFCAGAIVHCMRGAAQSVKRAHTDEALIAESSYLQNKNRTRELIRASRGAHLLYSIGLEADIEDCVQMGGIDLIARYDPTTRQIRAERIPGPPNEA